jgi:RNA polymerase sigma-70 factor (ECF subfamily)
MEGQRQESDLEAVRRVLAGDVEAFDGIVRRWQGPLMNMAYRYCRDRGRAEEWAQEAFLRAYRFLDRWRQDAAFSTWLFTVAANVYRSQARRTRPPEVPLAADRERAGPADVAAAVATTERAEIVRRAVCTLPARYRDAIVQYYFRDRDVGAVARTLGVRPGTVKARLHRGRALLEKRLARALGPGFGAEVT